MIPRILVVAGSDSGGGAGIQADIKAITMLGGHAMTAVTAITAQNTLGVTAIMEVPVDLVLGQIDAVVGDIGVDAVKIGMVGSAATALALAERLTGTGVPIVVDPVMVATSGARLADTTTIAALEALIALASVTTPNLPELAMLGGERRLRGLTPGAVLIKGGHGDGALLEDRLVGADGTETAWRHPRRDTLHTHGTGCTLASAIACGLGAGMPLAAATERAIGYVQAALAAPPGLGRGNGPIGHALGRVPYDDAIAARGSDA